MKNQPELGAFEKDLQAVLEKHNKVIYAAPTYDLIEGEWKLTANIKWADKPEEKKNETKSDTKAA